MTTREDGMRLDEFHALDAASAAAVVAVWAEVPWWVDAVVAGRPHRDVAALADHAGALAATWTDADVDAALAQHPRIGERPAGTGAAADASRAEQSATAASVDADTATALRAGNAAYEARFDRVFLIRAAGRSAAEVLRELERRLGNDDATERAEVAAQLREIALLRLAATITDDEPTDAEPVDDVPTDDVPVDDMPVDAEPTDAVVADAATAGRHA